MCSIYAGIYPHNVYRYVYFWWGRAHWAFYHIKKFYYKGKCVSSFFSQMHLTYYVAKIAWWCVGQWDSSLFLSL